MFSSNCCFSTHIQVSQERGTVWYSHVFKNFPKFVVIHIVKGFSAVKEADVFLEFPCFFYDPVNVGNSISGSSAFFKTHLYILKYFPGSSDGKASAYKAGDLGSIPNLGRSPAEGNGNPLQYSCLENSMDTVDYSPWGRKELDTTE